MHISPLFHPLEYKGTYVEVLDETLLPRKKQYIKVKDIPTACAVLRDMKTRAYGQVLLFYYTALIEAKRAKVQSTAAFTKRLALLTKQFSHLRPTFGFVQFEHHISAMIKDFKKNEDFVAGLEKRITGYIDSIERLKLNRVRVLSRLLPESPKILTICNVSGELVALALELQKQGRSVEFFVSETRPYLQGSRLTAWELKEAGCKVHLFTDSQAAAVMLKNNISAIVTGSDRCTRDGDVVNKVGTYSLAVLAKHFKVPFYSFVQPPGNTRSIKDIVIEYRDPKELISFDGVVFCAKNQKALYPSFDVTPHALVTKLIFFDGAYTPQEFKKKWQR